MQINHVVINASPLITLFKSNQTDLLPALFRNIIVPSAVWNEVTNSEQTDVAAQQIPKASWAKRTDIGAIAPSIELPGNDRTYRLTVLGL